MREFRAREIERLTTSGWATCGSIATLVAGAGLPPVTADGLGEWFSDEEWARAERAVGALAERFANARFADEVAYGTVLVPDPARLDTRQAAPAGARFDQLGAATPDVVDERLGDGVLGVAPGRPWTMVATVVGAYGPSLGSYDDVVSGPAERFVIDGEDTRRLMIRQVWGARVLQCGATPPDCEHNDRWTFTLQAGEPLVDGLAESGTVLKGKVRFRLGKPTRGIASARVAPALPII
ncbi:MAG: hypothetical protein S0880_07615 [Actinomycetota bacterium]|nr:hypothetical protein [Actinomycetota bacterium]